MSERFPLVSRRRFLGQAAIFAAGLTMPAFTRAATRPVGTLPLVKKVVLGPPSSYYAYTHANAFMPDGCTHVVARGENGGVTFLEFNPVTEVVRPLGSIAGADLYYSISADGRTMAETDGRRLLAWTVGSAEAPRVLINEPEGEEGKWAMNLSDISPDGSSIVTMRRHRGTPYKTLADGRGIQYQLLKHELAANRTTVGMEADWWINHVHFSPNDPSWVSMAHEGDSNKITRRLWGWNAETAPDGRMLFNQIGTDGGPLYVGHERAVFHKPACIFIAFGDSPGNPVGLYEVDFTGHSRLISEGPRDWHCNISRDGRWAVVDTTGPHDAPGRGWENAGSVSDILAVNMRTGMRAFLHRGTYAKHPYHPHPHISPDGRWVVFNDAQTRRTMALEIDQLSLKGFLES